MKGQPDTGCDLCWHAEASRWWRFRIWAGDLCTGDLGAYKSWASQAESHASAVRAALGGLPDTWYERHRREWERTGDPKHLTRMMRHVDDGRLGL